MDTTILIGLAGQTKQFRLQQAAYAELTRYLDRASARLQDDPDRAEVLGDLERSVGERLAAMVGATDRVVTTVDMLGILEEIGAVDVGVDQQAEDADGHRQGSGAGSRVPGRPPGRRLRRVREGQEIAGVCTGISAYSEIDVDWVRTVVILGTLVTGGILGVVYIALALILPITERPEVPG